jgi:transposase InsO family protein
MSSVARKSDLEPLNNHNYRTWAPEISGKLRKARLFRIIEGKAYIPDESTHPFEYEKYLNNVDSAAGMIFNALDHDQKVYVKGLEGDPVKMWAKLADVHSSKKPGMRFNAYDELFSIRLRPEESLPDLISRVGAATAYVKDVRPVAFTLDELDNELYSMTLIRALPHEAYSALIDSLMIMDELDPSTISEAFRNRHKSKSKRAEDDQQASTSMAMSAKAAPSPSTCVLCTGSHSVEACPSLSRAQQTARQPPKPRFNKQQGNRQQNNKSESAQSASTASGPAEHAGKAATVRPTSPAASGSAHTTDADEEWLTDTGATRHMTAILAWFLTYKPYRVPVVLANNSVIWSAGIGSVRFRPVVDGKPARNVVFTGVLHVPELQNNLLLVLQLTKEHGFKAHIDDKEIRFDKAQETWFTATIARSTPAAFLDGQVIPAVENAFLASSINTVALDIDLWLRRFSHHSVGTLKTMVNKKQVSGMRLASAPKPDPICEPCLAGKMSANPFPSKAQRSTIPLEVIHSNVHQLSSATREGYRYWVTYINECTDIWALYFMKRKSDTFDAFKEFKAFAENQLNAKIKFLQEDKGGEYMSNAFHKFLSQSGIGRRHSTRNRPQQNGVAERANRTIDEHTTSLLSQANLPASFKADAVAAYIYVRNRCSNASGAKTPFERFYGKKPDVSHLRIFGCTSYVHVQRDKRTGIGAHMEKCIFIGYPSDYKAWRLYNPATCKVVIAERAEFDERNFPGLSTKAMNLVPATNTSNASQSTQSRTVQIGGEVADDDDSPPIAVNVPETALDDYPPLPEVDSDEFHTPSEHSRVPSPSTPTSTGSPNDSPRPMSVQNTPPLALRRGRRDVRPPGEWWVLPRQPAPAIPSESESSSSSSSDEELSTVEDMLADDEEESTDELALAATSSLDSEPRSMRTAMLRPDAAEWTEAAGKEMGHHETNGTWDLVEAPPGAKILPSLWVFKIKRNPDGSTAGYKCRIVAQGNNQRPGFDYAETFAPTFTQASMRLIAALAVEGDLHMHSVDITSAFTNGDLEEDIYMRQPDGFHQGGANIVCKLNKSLYGLKQAWSTLVSVIASQLLHL